MAHFSAFDIVNLISKNDGEEARLTVRNKVGNPAQIPVLLRDVSMETGTDGTEVYINCKAIIPSYDLRWVEPKPKYPPLLGEKEMDELKELLCIQSPSKPAFKIERVAYNDYPLLKRLKIDKVLHNAPATIVFWMDGTKTVVKAVNEEYDPEKGIAMAYVKKMLGNKGNYYNNIKKWLPKQTEAKAEEQTEFTEEEA